MTTVHVVTAGSGDTYCVERIYLDREVRGVVLVDDYPVQSRSGWSQRK
jgi:hypothetical protein